MLQCSIDDKILRNLAPFCVGKLLVETLILSKLDYSCIVFYPLPSYELKRLQRVQNVWAGYVYGRYAKEDDCLSLGWLLVTVELCIYSTPHLKLHILSIGLLT